MEELRVRDIMVPLAEYATVSQDATLYEAVAALENAQSEFDQRKYKHRAVLVYNQAGKIVGKISQNDIIRGLEPGYKDLGPSDFDHWGLSRDYIKSLMHDHNLWAGPMDNICRKAFDIKVKDIMYTLAAGEYVEQGSSLGQAIHQLVIGYHQSLLVTNGKEVIGILRLTDVFSEIAKVIKQCEI